MALAAPSPDPSASPCTTRIEDYAFIGDCQSGALVSRDGSIDWLCLPRFDSASFFSALLGTDANGHWKISPPRGSFRSERRYVDSSMVLETTFTTETGSCRLTDALVLGVAKPYLVRLIEGVSGEVSLELDLVIRFDYGSIIPWVERTGERAFAAIAGPDALQFASAVDFENHDLRTRARFTVRAGQALPFVLAWHPSHERFHNELGDPAQAIAKTVAEWEKWAAKCTLEGKGREVLLRSLLTLKALTYGPTGGIVAALTTSLPEQLGGSRNWDYRYCWVRDATLTLYSMLLAGYRDEAKAWGNWLIRAVAGSTAQLNIMYGLSGERRLTETELDWLPGYQHSRPVRVGNAAHDQIQLDIFGELMDTALLGFRRGDKFSETAWHLLRNLLERLEKIWEQPDNGIWEMRGPMRCFTHSKVMAWVAFDRGIALSTEGKFEGPTDRWREIRERLHAEICERGFDQKLGHFTQTYGEPALDASLLMLPLVGFLPVSDPRIRGTIAAIEKDLLFEGFVRRYRPEKAHDGVDAGEKGNEGVFLACSFWLVDVYVLQGREEEARGLFDRLLALRNDLGLLSEEYDPVGKRLLGNFPQAFSHLSLINSAFYFFSKHSPVHERCGQEVPLDRRSKSA